MVSFNGKRVEFYLYKILRFSVHILNCTLIFRLISDISDVAQPIFMTLFSWSCIATCGALLLIAMELVEYSISEDLRQNKQPYFPNLHFAVTWYSNCYSTNNRSVSHALFGICPSSHDMWTNRTNEHGIRWHLWWNNEIQMVFMAAKNTKIATHISTECTAASQIWMLWQHFERSRHS